MSEGKIKTMKDSKVFVAKVLDEWVDEETGKLHRKIAWELLTKEISLGSIKNPNKDIVAIKFEVPREESSFDLGSLFRGLK